MFWMWRHHYRALWLWRHGGGAWHNYLFLMTASNINCWAVIANHVTQVWQAGDMENFERWIMGYSYGPYHVLELTNHGMQCENNFELRCHEIVYSGSTLNVHSTFRTSLESYNYSYLLSAIEWTPPVFTNQVIVIFEKQCPSPATHVWRDNLLCGQSMRTCQSMR